MYDNLRFLQLLQAIVLFLKILIHSFCCSSVTGCEVDRNPCQNGAICCPTGNLTAVCVCVDGYNGVTCEIEPQPGIQKRIL